MVEAADSSPNVNANILNPIVLRRVVSAFDSDHKASDLVTSLSALEAGNPPNFSELARAIFHSPEVERIWN